MNIFVSYTTRNNEVSIDSLINFSKKLKSLGKIFIDLIDNDSIDKQGRIIKELKTADVLLVIKSESTLYSEWVKFEIESADKLNIPIIEFHIKEIDTLSEQDIEEKIITYFSRITNSKPPFDSIGG